MYTAAWSLTCMRIHPVLVSCPCMHMENNRHWTVWINLLTKVQRKGWPCCAFLFFLSLQWLIQWCPDSFNSKYQTVKRHHIIYDSQPHSPFLSRPPARTQAHTHTRTHADDSSSYKMVRENGTYLLEPPWVLVIAMMRMMMGRMAVMHSAITSILFKAVLINSFNNGSNDTAEDINNSRCPELWPMPVCEQTFYFQEQDDVLHQNLVATWWKQVCITYPTKLILYGRVEIKKTGDFLLKLSL